jgi:hypothetical protein
MMKQSEFRMSEVKWFDNGRRRGHGRLDALYGGWGKVPVTRGEKLLYANLTLRAPTPEKADRIDTTTR